MQPIPHDLRAIILDYGMVLCRKPSLGEIARIAGFSALIIPPFGQL